MAIGYQLAASHLAAAYLVTRHGIARIGYLQEATQLACLEGDYRLRLAHPAIEPEAGDSLPLTNILHRAARLTLEVDEAARLALGVGDQGKGAADRAAAFAWRLERPALPLFTRLQGVTYHQRRRHGVVAIVISRGLRLIDVVTGGK